LPGASEYCRLLVRAYTTHPHYDDVLSPLNELALLIRNGGWHPAFDVPLAIQLLVGEDGQLGLYRRAPAMAVAWKSTTEVISAAPEALRTSFFALASSVCRWGADTSCAECHWRYVCGGLDGASLLGDGAPLAMSTMCEHRRLFLEHFARLRVPDIVVTPPEHRESP
jgi:hypothetical protein